MKCPYERYCPNIDLSSLALGPRGVCLWKEEIMLKAPLAPSGVDPSYRTCKQRFREQTPSMDKIFKGVT